MTSCFVSLCALLFLPRVAHKRTNRIQIGNCVRPAASVRLLLLAFLIATTNLWPQVKPAEAASTEGPQVEIGPTRKDFGEVFVGEELEQNFPVRNLGSKPLELSQKSALGMRTTPGARLDTAVWRPNQPRVARTVALRAAPS